MPRSARASAGGYCYHVINRGNARAEVFHKDEDLVAFVRIMEIKGDITILRGSSGRRERKGRTQGDIALY